MYQNNYPTFNNGIIWVQGESGAKSYIMAPNTTLALWDSEDQVIYLKSTDQNGLPSMKILEYKERIVKKDEYITKDELIKYMNENITKAINELREAINGKSNIPANESELNLKSI